MIGKTGITALILFLVAAGYGASFGSDSYNARSEDQSDDDILYADVPVDTSLKTQNPTVALFKSLFVPGLGQIGNKKYIKAGVIITLETTLIGTIVHYARKTSRAKKAFDDAGPGDVPRLFNEYQDARDQRNRFSWYTGTLIFISMFDAYVDAHLAQFPKIRKRFSFDIEPRGDVPVFFVVSCRL
jgi:hypothetical protein